MKKFILMTCLFMSMLMLQACKKDTANQGDLQDHENTIVTITPTGVEDLEPTAAPTVIELPSHEGEMRSYLTGLWVSEEIGLKRPYAIIFNNYKVARNQSGIGQADILYEALVEGGITRLLGIGENFTSDRIGSVRSARHYYVSIADEYDAIFIHYGKTKYAVSKIKELNIDNLDGETGLGSVIFYRDKSIKSPHNAFASVEGILAGIKKKNYRSSYRENFSAHYSFYEEDTDLAKGDTANKVTLRFSSIATPYLVYNTEDKLYYRYQFNGPHIDSNTGDQLAFKNIIIQIVKEWDIDKNDYQTMDFEDASGKGYYITNGKSVPISWKKNEASKIMRYYNEAGEELTMNPGKTYVAIYPDNEIKHLKIGD